MFNDGFILCSKCLHLYSKVAQKCFTTFAKQSFFYFLNSFDDPNLFLEELANNWQGLVTENWRFCFAIIFGLIMALLLPIVGIVW